MPSIDWNFSLPSMNQKILSRSHSMESVWKPVERFGPVNESPYDRSVCSVPQRLAKETVEGALPVVSKTLPTAGAPNRPSDRTATRSPARTSQPASTHPRSSGIATESSGSSTAKNNFQSIDGIRDSPCTCSSSWSGTPSRVIRCRVHPRLPSPITNPVWFRLTGRLPLDQELLRGRSTSAVRAFPAHVVIARVNAGRPGWHAIAGPTFALAFRRKLAIRQFEI